MRDLAAFCEYLQGVVEGDDERTVAESDEEEDQDPFVGLSGSVEYKEHAGRNKSQRPAGDDDPAQSSGIMDEGPRSQTAHDHGPGHWKEGQSGARDGVASHTLEIDG